ncbi:MAG: acyltransferase [Lachnospiraceae bacterium]
MNTLKSNNISMMRIVALSLVFLGHSVLFYVDNPHWQLRAPEQSSFAEWSILFIFYFTIPIFVFISGFLLAKSYQNRPQSLRKIIGSRFKRLIIPWFLVGALWLVPIYTLFDIPAYYRPSGTSLINGYHNFLIGLHTDHLWFLLALFWATLSCVLLLPIVKKRMFASIAITLLMALAAQLFLGSVDYYKLCLIALPILCFGFGMFFYHAKERIETLSVNRKRVLLLMLLVSMVTLICFDRSMKGNLYLGWSISIMGCVLFYYLFDFLQNKSIVGKVCSSKSYKWIESNNMEYYLFHMPFPKIFFIIFYPVLDIPPVLFIALTFLFTFLATTVVVWIIYRIKQQKNIIRIFQFSRRELPQND